MVVKGPARNVESSNTMSNESVCLKRQQTYLGSHSFLLRGSEHARKRVLDLS